ncbi:helix-turn-helix domain-containing protein [Streptomyces sp. NPDC059913]|uniref:helix-turn-helix domain-containing protein n=1 Tax=unclassified Streptomyces TaxID=2593676 RepID=UPI00364BBBC0
MTASTASGQLAEELRAIRARAGLSLAALAARTPYSKSSWERYLNGKKPAPRQAVEALCALTRTPPGRMLALWELADAEWSGRARPVAAPRNAPAPASSPEDRPEKPEDRPEEKPEEKEEQREEAGDGARIRPEDRPQEPGDRPEEAPAARSGVLWWAVAVAVVGVVAMGAAAGALAGGSSDEPDRSGRTVAATEQAVRNPGCRGGSCEGRNPVAMGCGGAGMVTTLASHTATGGRRLELRHAALCRAVWVRTTGLRPGDKVELSLSAGRSQQVTAVGTRDAGQYLSTPMAAGDSGADTRICLTVPGGRPECFTG